jgi:hypothetical protein
MFWMNSWRLGAASCSLHAPRCSATSALGWFQRSGINKGNNPVCRNLLDFSRVFLYQIPRWWTSKGPCARQKEGVVL